MTRTGVMASSRPPKAGAASTRRGRPGFSPRLVLAVAALVMSLTLLPGVAAAAEPGTSTYGEKPPTTTPKTGTLPSKETTTPTTTPEKEPAPAKEAVPTTTSTTPVTTKQLPFTGFDLRWDIAFGVLLMGAGVGILTLQRRQRR